MASQMWKEKRGATALKIAHFSLELVSCERDALLWLWELVWILTHPAEDSRAKKNMGFFRQFWASEPTIPGVICYSYVYIKWYKYSFDSFVHLGLGFFYLHQKTSDVVTIY